MCVCRAVRSFNSLSNTSSRSSASFETSSIPLSGVLWQPPSPSSSWTWTLIPPPSTRYSWCSLASRTQSVHAVAQAEVAKHNGSVTYLCVQVNKVLRNHHIKPHWMFAMDNIIRRAVQAAITILIPGKWVKQLQPSFWHHLVDKCI